MTLREKLVKIGARIVRHGRYVVFHLAEVAVPRALFAGDFAPDRASARVGRAGGGLTGADREAAGAERNYASKVSRACRETPGRPRSGFPPSTPASLSLTNDFPGEHRRAGKGYYLGDVGSSTRQSSVIAFAGLWDRQADP